MTVLEVGIGNGNKSIPISQYFKSYFGIEPLKYIYDGRNFLIKRANPNYKVQGLGNWIEDSDLY